MTEEKDKFDVFDISDGNLKVLETIPKMMKNEIYRNKLRFLVMEFLFSNKEKLK